MEIVMVNWKTIRAKFPAIQKYTYLNTAAGAPLSLEAAADTKQYVIVQSPMSFPHVFSGNPPATYLNSRLMHAGMT